MSWELLIPVIIQYGIPVAEKLWQLAQNKGEPTQADWDALKASASTTALLEVKAALVRNKIDPDSAIGRDMLASVS